MKVLLASISAIALAVSPSVAMAQGKGNGNGKGGGKEHSERGHKGNGNGKHAERGNGGGKKAAMQQAQRGPDRGSDRGPARFERNNFDREDRRERGNDANITRVRESVRGDDRREWRDDRRPNSRQTVRYGRDYDDPRYYGDDRRYSGLIDGCPPGLAKKRNGCLPPGQAKKLDDRRYRYANYSPDWWGLRGISDGRYFYDDGYLLRYGNGGVSGYIPLLGGALTLGNPWPRDYGRSAMPDYYVNYYGLGQPDAYRYADNVVYRLDPETAAITSVAALLTGDDFVVGQPVPRGYDVYNVPYSYREQYYDRPDAYYRYSDGYVYQVDPETRLVAAAIELLL